MCPRPWSPPASACWWWCAQQLRATPAAIGAIFALAGAGGLLGAVAGARVPRRWGFGPTMLGVRWAVALLWPLYALAPSPLALGAITAGLFFLNPVKNVALVSSTLPLIPEGLRARVVGLWDVLPAVSSSLGAALMGLGVQAIGAVATVAIATALMLLLALAATLNAHIRQAPPPSDAPSL